MEINLALNCKAGGDCVAAGAASSCMGGGGGGLGDDVRHPRLGLGKLLKTN